MPISCIVDDFLYLGSYNDSKDREALRSLGIASILNVARFLPNHFKTELEYHNIPLEDNTGEDAGARFSEGIDFIERSRDSEPRKRVLVHCQGGYSRSASIVLAFLMKNGTNGNGGGGMSYTEAFAHTKQRRPVICPNAAFVQQLKEYETELHGSSGLVVVSGGECKTRPQPSEAARCCRQCTIS